MKKAFTCFTALLIASSALTVTQTVEAATKKTTGFKNCTEMRKTYPNGVKKGHKAYASKLDRDKDNWACEKN